MPPAPPSHRPRRLAALLRHPRMGLALKAALAASIAWEIALRLPEPFAEYSFYAPFGAIAMMYPTVAGSTNQALRALAAVAVGGLIAVGADAAVGSGFPVVTIVVLLGMLLGGLRMLGEHAVYVPMAAVFILLLGQGDEFEYAAAYAGLFAMGAALSILINAAFPSLPFRQLDGALAGLRAAVTAHLEHLAEQFDELAEDDDGHVERAALGRPDLDVPTAAAREAIQHAQLATRGNLRARRSGRRSVDEDYEAFRSLERVVLLIDDLYDLLEDQPWGHDLSASPEDLREPVTRALRALVPTIEQVGVEPPSEDLQKEVDEAIADLTHALRRRQSDGGTDAEAFVVATIITSLRRCLAATISPDQLPASPS
ncbi:hypothetical protein J4G33_04955 [Actinotalea sp. BY-33]|uniref:FUSC family protein n=1 Tax=Actinotalea soli TaxID=2819234 RepID=A0A939RV06_9CELL|nr:hypothetical protein [Actinotalea soli]MBO1751148.1 hypothetical protein [Actinotalea soli]